MPVGAGSTSPGFTGTAVATRQPMRPPGTAVYFAEGGDVRGTTVHEPGCAVGCPRASFAWPDGLPAALKGANAPTNPVTYAEIASQPKSCA